MLNGDVGRLTCSSLPRLPAVDHAAGRARPEDPAIGQHHIDTAARGEAGGLPGEGAGLDVADVEAADGAREGVVGRQGNRAAGVAVAAELPAVGIVLAVLEAELGAVAAVAAGDDEVAADAETGDVGARGPLPDQLAVLGGDAVELVAVEEQPVAGQHRV